MASLNPTQNKVFKNCPNLLRKQIKLDREIARD